MFLSVSVAVTLGKRLVQWTIIDIQHNDRSFLDLFNEVKAGKFDCIEVIDKLAQATLHHMFVGKDKDKTMMTSAHHSAFSMCEEFGKYVKFVVDVGWWWWWSCNFVKVCRQQSAKCLLYIPIYLPNIHLSNTYLLTLRI